MKEPYGVNDEINFIETELSFFGHGSEIQFGYPAAYHDQLAAMQQETEEVIQELIVKRQGALATGRPIPMHHLYSGTDDEFEITIDDMRSHVVRDINHHYYEMRFRGRYDPFEEDEYEAARSYIHQDEASEAVPYPGRDQMCDYLNEHLVRNAWRGGYGRAYNWYHRLEADHPDRVIAADYIGFYGNIILQQYCRTAKALADQRLADDDFFSVKHLVTVCLPLATDLEEFTPREARQAKQYLREVFLQCAQRGVGGMRGYLASFGYLSLDEESPMSQGDDWLAIEDEHITRLMRYKDTDEHDQQVWLDKVISRSGQLAAGRLWYEAADMLDLARRAFDLPLDPIRARIDELALEAVAVLTEDISALRAYRTVERYERTRQTSNYEELEQLVRLPGLSQDVRDEIVDLTLASGVKYAMHMITHADEASETAVNGPIEDLIDKLSRIREAHAAQFANEEITGLIMEHLQNPVLTDLLPTSYDGLVKNMIHLLNLHILSIDQFSDSYAAMVGSLGDRIEHDPEYKLSFERLIALISPILRASKASEDPQGESIWKLIDPHNFQQIIDDILIGHATDSDLSIEFLGTHRQQLLDDIRGAWQRYWQMTESYSC